MGYSVSVRKLAHQNGERAATGHAGTASALVANRLVVRMRALANFLCGHASHLRHASPGPGPVPEVDVGGSIHNLKTRRSLWTDVTIQFGRKKVVLAIPSWPHYSGRSLRSPADVRSAPHHTRTERCALSTGPSAAEGPEAPHLGVGPISTHALVGRPASVQSGPCFNPLLGSARTLKELISKILQDSKQASKSLSYGS